MTSASAVTGDQAATANGWWSWLMAARASIEFTADRVTTAELELRDVAVPIEFRDGRASIERGAAKTNGGALTFTGAYAVDTREFDASIRGDALTLTSRSAAAPDTAPLFPPVPFVPRWLPELSGTLDVQIDRLVFAGAEATAVSASATFEPTRLTLKWQGSFGDGVLTLDAAHTYASGETSMNAAANALALDAFQNVREYLSGATLDGTATLNGKGRSLRELAASADGRVRARIGRGTLNNLELERLNRNVLAMTLLSVIPFRHPAPRVPLECAALRLDLEHGHSADGPLIVALSEKFELIGRGTLDLDSEQIALELRPARQTGLALGTPGTPRTVSITGALRAPVLRAAAGDLLHESLAIGTSLTANPLTRAADKVFARGAASPPDCAARLGD